MIKKKKKNNSGRPTVMTKETLGKLNQAFAIGCTDKEACIFADINPSSLYDYQKENPEYTERKALLKEKPVLKARMNVMDALNKKDKETSKWYLERKRKKEFSTRTEQTFPEEIKYSLKITRFDGQADKLADNPEAGSSTESIE